MQDAYDINFISSSNPQPNHKALIADLSLIIEDKIEALKNCKCYERCLHQWGNVLKDWKDFCNGLMGNFNSAYFYALRDQNVKGISTSLERVVAIFKINGVREDEIYVAGLKFEDSTCFDALIK